uniref:Uncharacterized protein n=1 Tax=Rheinheimera sp. BAL341 TaxID=1708203 RepID=A0A486XI16_9GAMM
MQKISLGFVALAVSCSAVLAQQSTDVQIETRVTGNPEQPKTIFILPWQSPVSVIRIPGQPLPQQLPALSPLDRQQFLRFIALQQTNSQAVMPAQTLPRKEQ